MSGKGKKLNSTKQKSGGNNAANTSASGSGDVAQSPRKGEEVISNKYLKVLISDLDKNMSSGLQGVSDDVAELKATVACMPPLVTRIAELEKMVKDRDEKIVSLEKRVDDNEQNSKLNNVIMDGFPANFADAVVAGTSTQVPKLPPIGIGAVLKVLNEDVKVPVLAADINTVHYLPGVKKIDGVNTKSVIVKFVRRLVKDDVYRNKKNLKGKKLYVREHLTKKNSDIFKVARDLRSEKKVVSAWTFNVVVYIKPRGPPDQTHPIAIKDMSDFAENNLS